MVVASKPPYAAIATVNLTRTLRAAYALTRTLHAACATLRQPWFSNVFSKAYARLAPSLRELTPAGFFRVCLTFWPSSRQSSEKLTRSLRELTHALFFNQNSNRTARNQQQNSNKRAKKQQQPQWSVLVSVLVRHGGWGVGDSVDTWCLQ